MIPLLANQDLTPMLSQIGSGSDLNWIQIVLCKLLIFHFSLSFHILFVHTIPFNI